MPAPQKKVRIVSPTKIDCFCFVVVLGKMRLWIERAQRLLPSAKTLQHIDGPFICYRGNNEAFTEICADSSKPIRKSTHAMSRNLLNWINERSGGGAYVDSNRCAHRINHIWHILSNDSSQSISIIIIRQAIAGIESQILHCANIRLRGNKPEPCAPVRNAVGPWFHRVCWHSICFPSIAIQNIHFHYASNARLVWLRCVISTASLYGINSFESSRMPNGIWSKRDQVYRLHKCLALYYRIQIMPLI